MRALLRCKPGTRDQRMLLAGGVAQQKVDHASRGYRSDLIKGAAGLDQKVRAGGQENGSLRVFRPEEFVDPKGIPEKPPCSRGFRLHGDHSAPKITVKTELRPEV